MVDIDPLDAKDEETVRRLVEKHIELTASPRARSIIEQWPKAVKKFVKIFPHDYKKVLGLSSDKQTKKATATAATKEKVNG
jgi:glutamate synthase domain-containing protein 3